MCFAIPGKVVEVDGDAAIIEIEGKRSRVSLVLLSEDDRPAVGDYLVAHLGVALERIEESEAVELMAMVREIAGTEEMGVGAA